MSSRQKFLFKYSVCPGVKFGCKHRSIFPLLILVRVNPCNFSLRRGLVTRHQSIFSLLILIRVNFSSAVLKRSLVTHHQVQDLLLILLCHLSPHLYSLPAPPLHQPNHQNYRSFPLQRRSSLICLFPHPLSHPLHQRKVLP